MPAPGSVFTSLGSFTSFGFAMFTALVAAWFGSLVLVGRSLSPSRLTDPPHTPSR